MQNAMIVCDSVVNKTAAVTRHALFEFHLHSVGDPLSLHFLVYSPSQPLPAKHLPGNKLCTQRSLREFARS